MSYSIFRRFGSGHHSGVTRPALFWVALAALALTACGKKEEAATPQPVAATVAAGSSAEVAPGAAAAVMPASVPQLLDNAKTAFRQDRLVSPVGDNAIEYYLAVLGMEKDNLAATQGLVDLFPLGVSVAEKEIAARNVEEAERIIGLLDESSPNSYTVQKLKSRLAATQNQMQREEERRLAAEQAQQARETAAAAPPEPVAAPPPASAAATAAREAAARPVPEPAESRPAPPVAATTEPARPVGETRDAKVVRQVQPGYPQLAYRRRLAGWVEIQFTVGVNGRVSDVQVLRADPQRMFDREAVRAVEQWMFEPALRDGVPVPSTLSRRIEFKYPG